MADFNSSLPIRTQNAGDVISKIADATTPSQQLAVNADGSINITDNSGSLTVDATNLDIRDLTHVSDSVKVGDGTDLLAVNADGSINSVVTATNLDIRDLTHVSDSIKVGDGTDFIAVNADGSLNITDNGGSLTVDASDLDIRDLSASQDNVAISDGTDTLAVNADGSINSVVTATNLDIRDLTHASDSVKVGDGSDFLAVNADGSINVVFGSGGDEICDYQTSAAVAGGASTDHDYTVTTAKTLLIEQAYVSGSGKIKAVLAVETAPASDTYTTKFVAFNSTAAPDIEIPIKKYLTQAGDAKVRITITNRDVSAQDVYSTLTGLEQ